MRTDPNRGQDLRKVSVLEDSSRRAASALASDAWGKDSLSGEERNHLFLSDGGRQFHDVSAISGADHVGDGRSVVLLDYDRDGWMDLAGVNANAPTLVVFRNEIGARPGMAARQVVALRFQGGNTRATADPQWSNRDGYGARVTVEAGGRRFVEEHRCGEGFSAQNSRTLLVGLGEVTKIDRITVRWPSGREQSVEGVAPGSLVTVFEDAAQAPREDGFAIGRFSR